MESSKRRQQMTESVTKAVKSAGTLTVTALVISAMALLVSVVALVLAVKHG
jgi:hypothetical protein